jgi:PAS domain S-box-containing protein
MTSQAFGSFGPQAVARLRAAFERSGRPMLIADDDRRWVTGNAAAAQLLGITREEIPWSTMDDVTPASEQSRLAEQWRAFLRSGGAEGVYELFVAGREHVPVEFGAVANVQPARHLAVFMPLEQEAQPTQTAPLIGEPAWSAIVDDGEGRRVLTKREREVMALIAAGGRSEDVADELFVSPETVKSHVQNALSKLGAHTRAHAVAIALVTGQITDEWPLAPKSADP